MRYSTFIMSEEIKRERSKNCPNIALSVAVELARKLYNKAGKTKIKAEVAANALGYSGMNGAALTTLGAISQYGLIDRDKGMVSISAAAVRVLHPTTKDQEIHTLEELALNPAVFNELYTNGFNNADEDVISNHLIQNGFTPDRAKKAASVFKANIELANLNGNSIKESNVAPNNTSTPQEFTLAGGPQDLIDAHEAMFGAIEKKKSQRMLAQYTVPIGSTEFAITVTGEKLGAEDFDVLKEYADIWKRQFERKQKAEESQNLASNLNKMFGVGKESAAEPEKAAVKHSAPPPPKTKPFEE